MYLFIYYYSIFYILFFYLVSYLCQFYFEKVNLIQDHFWSCSSRESSAS